MRPERVKCPGCGYQGEPKLERPNQCPNCGQFLKVERVEKENMTPPPILGPVVPLNRDTLVEEMTVDFELAKQLPVEKRLNYHTRIGRILGMIFTAVEDEQILEEFRLRDPKGYRKLVESYRPKESVGG